jgi:hypothetical protein
MFFDRDVETGKRVFQTTEKGSTERLKAIWQDETNAYLQELGIDARIQFGPKVEEEPTIPTSPANIPITLSAVEEPVPEGDQFMEPHEKVSDHLPEQSVTECHEPSEEGGHLQEPEPTAYVDPPPEEPALITREGTQLTLTTARDLLDTARERTMLLTAIDRRNAAWDAFKHAEETLEQALGTVAGETLRQTMAANALRSSEYQLERTRGKGFRLSLFGFEWKSSRYKQAEAAQSDHNARLEAYERAQVALYNANQNMEAAGEEWQRLQETAITLNDQLKVYGTEEELVGVLDTLQSTIKFNVENLNFAEVKDMFDGGELTREEYLEVVTLMGGQQEQDMGESEGQSY